MKSAFSGWVIADHRASAMPGPSDAGTMGLSGRAHAFEVQVRRGCRSAQSAPSKVAALIGVPDRLGLADHRLVALTLAREIPRLLDGARPNLTDAWRSAVIGAQCHRHEPRRSPDPDRDQPRSDGAKSAVSPVIDPAV
jgi:hypothetical protein